MVIFPRGPKKAFEYSDCRFDTRLTTGREAAEAKSVAVMGIGSRTEAELLLSAGGSKARWQAEEDCDGKLEARGLEDFYAASKRDKGT